jgi:hypothetical protein
VRRDLNYLELGGKPCRCVEILFAWRQRLAFPLRAVPALPGLLRAAADAAANVSRRRAQRAAESSPEMRPWHRRPDFLARLLDRLLHTRAGAPASIRCILRTIDDYYNKNNKIHWLMDDVHFGVLHTTNVPIYILELKDGERTVLRTTILCDWLDEVYRRGLAVVQGALTLGFRGPLDSLIPLGSPPAQSEGNPQLVQCSFTEDGGEIVPGIVERKW